MNLQSATMLQALPESKTLSILNKVTLLKQEGHDIINLAGGDPDFNTPNMIIEEAENAMKLGMTHYVSSNGIPELRNEIAHKLKTENGVNYDPSQIIVTAGGKPALYVALKSIINPGDEVLVINPAWVSFEPLITMVGGHAVSVDLNPNDHFKLTKDLLDAACTERTKAIIVNNPNNPTGRVLTNEEFHNLRDVVIEKDLIIIADEVYEKLVYGTHQFTSLASIPRLENRTITVQSFSKGHAMTGWRLGYLALPNELVPAASNIQGHLATCTPAFIQKAGVVALKEAKEEVEHMRRIYDKRINQVVTYLNQIPGVICPHPEGAFYVFPEIKFRNFNSIELANYLLDEANVAVTPGIAFGSSYMHNIRISCAMSEGELEEALRRIEKALTKVV
ncbi:pyridoxal phosphate-dependent aminotransferase [Peribacillus frigoritolerans]|uniref:pyridoxal phosphate-dependent aminotransferase n=1 Tax=Peribacillus frigoritolerans TaxID=450367 RepID=UPI001EFE6072|nr:pyridoxal phosphate-dependent aminotransferase [Peribacillus frigoritolerans]ULM95216.1 pyridoxal phosphate-dependent aminotransferase [Peribacillus frigoritolerans]